jgi:hypothetical protein
MGFDWLLEISCQQSVDPPELSPAANASTLAKETSDSFSLCAFKFTLNTIVAAIAKTAILPRIIFFITFFYFKIIFSTNISHIQDVQLRNSTS